MNALPPFWSMMIWGLLGTVAMTTILQDAQGLGLSRLWCALRFAETPF